MQLESRRRFVCRCSVPEGRGSLTSHPPPRAREGEDGGRQPQSTGELTTRGRPWSLCVSMKKGKGISSIKHAATKSSPFSNQIHMNCYFCCGNRSPKTPPKNARLAAQRHTRGTVAPWLARAGGRDSRECPKCGVVLPIRAAESCTRVKRTVRAPKARGAHFASGSISGSCSHE